MSNFFKWWKNKPDKEEMASSTDVSTKTTHSSSMRVTTSFERSTTIRSTTTNAQIISGQKNQQTSHRTRSFSQGSLPSKQPTISEALKKPINLNYKSPYRQGAAMKDAILFTRPAYEPKVQKLTSSFERLKLAQPTRNTGPVAVLKAPLKYNHPHRPISMDEMNHAMTIKVIRNGRFYDKEKKVPTYSTHGKNRGCLILINNILFKSPQATRKGAKVDEKNLKSLFSQLNFKIEDYRDLKKNEIESKLQSYSKKRKLKDADMSAVIIMSHGDGDKSGSTKVLGTDDKQLAIGDIIEMFNNANCPYLKGKPKIFIFLCCRGEKEAKIETDTKRFETTSAPTDMLLAYSTVPGFVSYRHNMSGTYYTTALCDTFMQHACDTHLEDMLKIVDRKLSDLVTNSGIAQTSSYENRGFKQCYLHP